MKKPSANRLWLILVGVLIVAGVAAYGAGFYVEHSARTRDAVIADRKAETMQADLKTAQTQSARLAAANALLSANVWTYRAAAALDERNFGVANEAVGQAAARLKAVDPAVAGLDAAAVTAVQAEAADIHISVASNLQGQRAQLLKLAADVNALVETGTP